MATVLQPSDEAGVAEAVRSLDGGAVEIRGGGRLQGFGRPVASTHVLDLAGLTGIDLYRPTELVFRAKAGTTVAEADAALDEAGQAFPFEPPDLGPLLGNGPAQATLGGLVATNLSGPARIARGALRDSLIGVRFVEGNGHVMRSGGRVMKNVTGLDLVKLSAGAHGTLGVLTEVTFKLLPRAEAEATLCLSGVGAARAGAVMSAAMASPLEVSAAAWLPAAVAARSEAARAAGSDVILLRLETFSAFLAERVAKLERHLRRFGPARRIVDAESKSLWRTIRDVHVLAEPAERCIWRLAVPPAEGPALLDAIVAEAGGEGFADWAGGLLWLAVPGDPGSSAGLIRGRTAAAKGHATLVRAAAVDRARIAVFEPQPGPIRTMTERLKTTFDPHRRLNPGRMFEGV